MHRRLSAAASMRAALAAVVAAVAAGCGLLGPSGGATSADGRPPPVVAATFDGHDWMPARPAAMQSDLGAGRWNTEFNLIACPAARACFVAGAGVRRTDGRVVAGLVARLVQGRWSAAERLPGGPEQPGALSCASVSSCVAVGSTATYVLDSAAWKRGPAFPGNGSRTVACAAPDFCAEVQPTEYRYETFQRGAWTAPRIIAPLPGTNLLPNLLSCASPTFCLGMAQGYAYWIFDGTGWTPGRRTGFPLAGSHWLDPTALSCASPSFCVAVGGNVQGEAMASVYNGNVWSTPVAVVKRSGYSRLTSVSCPTTRFCAAAGTWSGPPREFAVTFKADRWSSPTPLASTQGDPSVACAAATYCLALGGEVRS